MKLAAKQEVMAKRGERKTGQDSFRLDNEGDTINPIRPNEKHKVFWQFKIHVNRL